MKRILAALFLFLGFATLRAQDSVFEYKVTDDSGRIVSLSQYSGKVLLIVNTLSSTRWR